MTALYERSLCTFAKNESHCIANMLRSVLPFVDDVVLVDTGSEDQTIQIATDTCKEFNRPIQVYKVQFSDFGSIRTVCAHLANQPWVLMLDSDEVLEGGEHLWHYQDKYITDGAKAWAFPRKRWLDIDMTQQTELSAYPDYQVRFFMNNKNYTFKRELHEFFNGTAVEHSLNWKLPEVTIHHLHDVFKTPEMLQQREQLYKQLAIKAGLQNIEGGKS